jgi:hypothetical protein
LTAKIFAHLISPRTGPVAAGLTHLEAKAAPRADDTRNRFIADPRQAPNRADRLAHLLADDNAAE